MPKSPFESLEPRALLLLRQTRHRPLLRRARHLQPRCRPPQHRPKITSSNPSDPVLTSLIKNIDIAAGSFTIQSLKFTPPKTLKAGSYRLFLKATPSFSESDSKNNTASSHDKVTPTSPVAGIDLGIAFSSMLPANFTFGSPNTVTATINNLGTIDSTKPIRIGLYASSDKTLSSNAPCLAGTLYSTKLKSHGTATVDLTFTTPHNFTPGTYYVALKVDADNAVKESNENNNVIFSPIKIRF